MDERAKDEKRPGSGSNWALIVFVALAVLLLLLRMLVFVAGHHHRI